MQIKIIAILGAGCLLMGLTIGLLIKRLDTVRTERDQAIDFSNAREDSLVYYRNEWGRQTARSVVLDLTLKNLRRLQSDERLAWIRQFESVNKRLNNLESATRTTAQVVGEWELPVAPGDASDWEWLDDTTWLQPQIRLFDNHDEWVRIQGTVTDDTVIVHADAKVPIESVVVWERKRWPDKKFGLRIGRKQWFTETASPNPYVNITESTVIRVGKRKGR